MWRVYLIAIGALAAAALDWLAHALVFDYHPRDDDDRS